MPSVYFSGKARGTAKGSALVIVLFFVILLSVVTIAFLSRSLTAVKVSASSAGETKSRILASSASDIIIGDFKQEIIAGSSGVNADSTPTLLPNYPVYIPSSNLNMIPFQNGIPPTTGTAIPNLISRSVSPANTTGTDPYIPYPARYVSTALPPNRAASDPTAQAATYPTTPPTGPPYTTSKVSSSYPSLNGRLISPAQWNSHYLIPRNTPSLTSLDSTPIASFVTPDWVIVTRAGATSQTWNNNLYDPTLTNTGYAVGRYAYAVYNEGGLLDMNVAGYPGTDSGSSSVGLSATQIGMKGSLALADLTQLPQSTTSATTMTQAQINNFVGWRNYASAGLSGSYGNLAFSSTSSGNWLTNFVSFNTTNGFMQILPSGVTSTNTDQALLSRQQLISVINSLGISDDFLQYMGSFSRALEQPSTIPDSSRPKILTAATGQASTPAPPLYNQADSYQGNSDAQGGDATINPSFLTIRAATNFTRLNGVAAVLGEPLVKTKFPLSWLSQVAYNATSANGSTIYKEFGLTRSGTSGAWTYNHGQNSIMTLSAVAALTAPNAREPDFAELLKAAIIAGSLGKGGPNFHNNGYNYQYTIDTSFDTQVIQVMANLIDQQDADSYPTVITIGNNTVYGVEDLPYFYRYHLMSVVDSLPSGSGMPFSRNASLSFTAKATDTTTGTLSGPSQAVNYLTGTTQGATWTLTNTNPATVSGIKQTTLGSAASAGEVTLLYVPDLWNPHDPNTAAATSSVSRPTQFRIYAVTDDPVNGTTGWQIGSECTMNGSNGGGTAPNVTSSYSSIIPEKDSTNTYYNWPIAATKPFSQATTTMLFSDNNGTLFREPTLLWNNHPTGLNLSTSGTSVGSVIDANTSQTYYGIIAGKAPVCFQATFSSVVTASGAADPTPGAQINGTYVFEGSSVTTLTDPVANSYPQISFFLQYLDPSGSWVTYDIKYPDLHGLNPPPIVADAPDDFATSFGSPLAGGGGDGQLQAQASGIDPRSARWGIGTATTLGNKGNVGGQNYLLEPTANSFFNAPTSLKPISFNVIESNRPRVDQGDFISFSNPCMTSDPPAPSGLRNLQMRWFSVGEYRFGSTISYSPFDFDGMFSQNNPAIQSTTLSQSGTTTVGIYNEDPDAVVRLAMGAYADTTLSGSTVGLPMATASTFTDAAVATPTSQSQSRPLILNRPFHSVAEMSYAFRGTPWKNIDFFTPASGDSALLDTFCINPPPATALVAGKVDLNTRQIPVLQAMVAKAYVDEIKNAIASPPSYALPPLTGSEAKNIATTLQTITTDTTHAWRGPLQNVSGLVGRYVASPGTTSDTDLYTYSPPALANGTTMSPVSYAGLSSAIDCSSFNGTQNRVFANSSTPLIQRFRESAIRPLVDSGQVRVWNLLVDVVAQTGHYPKTASGFDQFVVDGQTRLWVHVAIDRLTGQVLDRQVEVVTP